ncbi:hypothetical protein HXA34_20680 [Salipaludibacillus agaradhaerens]|uniref:hypothetical protein n=1 Tax=Salipaludibacillus agaradhaerens TaxID=76935 RepID=UPI0021509AF5|nr:hypothetical protein [Salipaludibacillus agaradhaerens]MCR6108716.1 hypothetical protein [Salipaludibacillus agaradhaerens]MCR6120739.1 hypothetical protein [Salipaludibacillus agaradhaerens]
MTTGHKIGLLMDYLQAGGEVEIDGYTWVWLDNHITGSSTGENGETQYWGINGLAIKTVRIKGNEESPHYMGQGTLPFQSFVGLANRVKDEEWVGICAGNALQSMNKKR